MSYLNLSKSLVLDASKLVISIWFRCPQKSMDAAKAAFVSDEVFPEQPKLLNGIIPLIVMGKKGTNHTFMTESTPIYDPLGGVKWYQESTTYGPEFNTNPTCIGINCDPSFDRPVLYINFETNTIASVVNRQYDNSDPPFGYSDVTDIVTNVTQAINGTNIYLASSGSGGDKWHHLLVSLDFKTVETRGLPFGEIPTGTGTAEFVDSASRLFVALDDVNYDEFDLSNNFVNGSADHNAVIPELAISVAGQPQNVGHISSFPFTGPIGGVPGYSLSNPKIPSETSALGLPGTMEFVQNIYQVEMAEFQMFTNVTLDTRDKTNRRAFVSVEGKPVPPNQKQSMDDAGNVTTDSGSIELLGKRPEILLHGSGKWINGNNTGTLGVDADGNKIPEGQFVPTAKIRKYKPDPSLYGPQSLIKKYTSEPSLT